MPNLEIPRQLCSGSYPLDSLWCSKGIQVTLNQKTNIMDVKFQSQKLWSPGMTIFIVKDAVSQESLQALVSEFSTLSHRWGKARRISIGMNVPHDLLCQLYECFNCIEFVGTDGTAMILDDGCETTSIARML